MNFPFQQELIGTKLKRTFSPTVDSLELKWHQDLKDRKVTILEDGGWQFQIDDELPKKLNKSEQLFIPKMTWHRVIKGNSDLIVEIEELD